MHVVTCYVGRMSPLNEEEFKTYLAKTREKRDIVLQFGAAEAKLDVSGVTIRKLKRKGGGNSKEGSPSLSDTEPIAVPPLNNVTAACGSKVVLPSPRKRIKKEKTCVPMEGTDITSLWDRRFDGMGFVDSNLSFTKDVQEVKESGLEKASEVLVAYSLRSALLGKVITDQFRAVLGHERNCRDELNSTKEKLKIANDTLGDMKKQILKVNKRLEEEQTALTQLEKKTENNEVFEEEVVGLKKSVDTLKGKSAAKDMEIEDLKKSIDTLKGQSAAKDMEIEDLKKSIYTLKGQSAAKDMEIEDLKKSVDMLKRQSATKDMEIEDLKQSIDTLKGQSAAKDMEIEDLKVDAAFRYQDGFDKAIEQVHILFPSFDLSEADAMKSVVDGKLV
jgi:predicted  nucleic acid-binding Zn-ribbon protein